MRTKALLIIFFLFTMNIYSQNKSNYSNNQIILKFANKAELRTNNTFNNNIIDRLNRTNRLKSAKNIDTSSTNTFLLSFSESKDINKIIEEYRSTKLFEFVEPNYIAHCSGVKGNLSTTPNDSYFSNRQWGLLNNGTFTVSGMSFTSTNDADVDMELAWDIETGDPNLTIAVIDSGLNLAHQDISSRIWNKSSETANDGIDNDGNGLIDDYRGWDWVNTDNNPTDDNGHGTNCAGIIGAIANNSVGYAGVNWNSKIMPLKVLDNNGSGDYSNIISSIYYAVNNGAKIISISIGGDGNSTAMSNAIDYANTKGVLVVACMMNFNNNTTYYPAGYASGKDNVIAVGSTDSNDKRSNPFFWSTTSGSNYGNHISVVAPGNYIWGLGKSGNDYNSYWGGTSQATPLVAGIASLLKSKESSLTPLQIKNIITSTAQDKVGLSSEDIQGWDQYMGWGRVNAYSALNKLNLGNDTVETISQKISIFNPIQNNQLKINISEKLAGKYEISIIDFSGKNIFTKSISLSYGINILDFNYPKGNYIITIKGKNYTKIFKLMKL